MQGDGGQRTHPGGRVGAPFSTYQLRAAPDEGQKLKVVQAPHSLAAGWLHPVRLLELPHDLEVPAQGGRKRATK